MGENLGSAILRLSTDSSKLDQGIKSAKEKAENLSAGFLKAGAAVSAIGLPFALMGKAALDNADKFNKMSEKVGISVEDLSGLKFAAEIAGTDLDALQNSLGRFSGNAADASKGIGEAKDTFEELGISVVDVEEAFALF